MRACVRASLQLDAMTTQERKLRRRGEKSNKQEKFVLLRPYHHKSLSLSFPLRIRAISIVSREEQKKSWDWDFIFLANIGTEEKSHFFVLSPPSFKKGYHPPFELALIYEWPRALEYGRGNGWRLLCCSLRQRGRVKKWLLPSRWPDMLSPEMLAWRT